MHRVLGSGFHEAEPLRHFTASVDRDGKRFLGNVWSYEVRKENGQVVIIIGLQPLARSLSNSIVPRAEYVETFDQEES